MRDDEKGVRPQLPARSSGCCAQLGSDPFCDILSAYIDKEVGEEEFGDFNNEEEDEVGFINNLIDYLVFEGLSKASRPWTY